MATSVSPSRPAFLRVRHGHCQSLSKFAAGVSRRASSRPGGQAAEGRGRLGASRRRRGSGRLAAGGGAAGGKPPGGGGRGEASIRGVGQQEAIRRWAGQLLANWGSGRQSLGVSARAGHQGPGARVREACGWAWGPETGREMRARGPGARARDRTSGRAGVGKLHTGGRAGADERIYRAEW